MEYVHFTLVSLHGLSLCIGYSWPAERQVAAIPWADIFNHPDDYYDAERFKSPTKLRAPERLSVPDLWNLASFLQAEPPFVFREKREIVERSCI